MRVATQTDGVTNMMTPKEVGQRIKKIRRDRHWSQEVLANIVGITRTYISAYERGIRYPSCYVLIGLCKASGVSADWLLGLKEGE